MQAGVELCTGRPCIDMTCVAAQVHSYISVAWGELVLLDLPLSIKLLAASDPRGCVEGHEGNDAFTDANCTVPFLH